MTSFSWLSGAALAVTLALFVGLFLLRRKRIRFTARTLIALAAGIGVGLAFPQNLDYIGIFGEIYVQVITAVVAPLIFVSILSSITSLGSTAKLKTLGASSAFWLLLTNAIAILLTLGVSLVVGIGKGANLELDGLDGSSLEKLVTPLDEVILGFFPQNIAGDVLSNNILPLIVFALLLSVSFLLVNQKNELSVRPFKEVVDATKTVLYRAVGFIIALTPYAVLALVAVTTATAASRIETVLSLVGVLVLAVAISFFDAYVINGVLLSVFADVNPVRFFAKLTPAQYTAFTTQSSVGTLPLTISTLTRKVGVSEEVAGFTAPIGTTIGMPGCAGIWPILVAVFSINALGIEYTVVDYLVLVVLGLLVSLGTAGVPGTAIITATAVLTAVGLPIEVLVLLIPISAVAGTASTMANVTAAATAATIVARRSGTLDDSVFADRGRLSDSPTLITTEGQ